MALNVSILSFLKYSEGAQLTLGTKKNNKPLRSIKHLFSSAQCFFVTLGFGNPKLLISYVILLSIFITSEG